MSEWTLEVDKQDLADRFGKAALEYDRHAQLQQEVGESLLLKIPQRNYPLALDLGCGTGFFLPKLRPLCQQIVALDLAQGMLGEARRRSPDAWLVCGDADRLPLTDQRLDLIFSSLALQWCACPATAFRELYRVLKPGGILAFSTLTAGTLTELRQAWRQVDELDHVNRFIEAHELQKLVEQAGFKPLQWKCVQHRLHYPGLPELLKSLKGIGANQVGGRRAGGLGGRQRYASLEQGYARFRDPQGLLPVTYEVCYGVLCR